MDNKDLGVLTILENTSEWPITSLNVSAAKSYPPPPQLSYVKMIISLKIVQYCNTLLSIYMRNIKMTCSCCCNRKIYYMKFLYIIIRSLFRRCRIIIHH